MATNFMIFSLIRVSICTEPFSTIHDFIVRQVSQNKAILSIPSGVKLTIGLNTSTSASHTHFKMTLTCRTTRQSDKPVRRPCTNILPTFSLLNLIWGHLPVTRCGQLNIWRALSENMENSNLGTRLSCQLLIWFRLNREPREGRKISRWWLKPSNQKQNESSRRLP